MRWVTRCCSRFPRLSTRPCGSRKNCFPTPISTMPRRITSWAYDQAVHADLRLLAPDRLGCPRLRTTRQQPHHPTERRIHRRRTAQVRANRTTLNRRALTPQLKEPKTPCGSEPARDSGGPDDTDVNCDSVIASRLDRHSTRMN